MPDANLPKCFDRFCKHRARYTVPHYIEDDGSDGPEIKVCGIHRKWYEAENARSRRVHDFRVRRDALQDLGMNLETTLLRLAGLEITADVAQGARGITLSTEDIRNLLAWLDTIDARQDLD